MTCWQLSEAAVIQEDSHKQIRADPWTSGLRRRGLFASTCIGFAQVFRISIAGTLLANGDCNCHKSQFHFLFAQTIGMGFSCSVTRFRKPKVRPVLFQTEFGPQKCGHEMACLLTLFALGACAQIICAGEQQDSSCGVGAAVAACWPVGPAAGT